MFGLKEMMENLKAFSTGNHIPVVPSSCRYVAKEDHQAKREGDRLKGVGGIPTETIRIVKVKYEDFLKNLPARVIEKWILEQSKAGKLYGSSSGEGGDGAFSGISSPGSGIPGSNGAMTGASNGGMAKKNEITQHSY
mmetsp:Transcript_15744/g.24213  ORF Transcript_15744/g.24213 Transcript_15744/m.24213 type:complete len:137 (+) Transcript_15744:5612-6022(+)